MLGILVDGPTSLLSNNEAVVQNTMALELTLKKSITPLLTTDVERWLQQRWCWLHK